jgi:DNA-binding XRE family transcriptional regulator
MTTPLVGWVPFEERPRPAQLARVKLTIDQMQRIEITTDDDDEEVVIGMVFAWLLGQAMLERQAQQDDDSAATSMTLGQRILLARTKRGLSQAKLAKRLGVTRAAVSQWEKDQYVPRLPVLHALAEALGRDVEWFTEGSVESRSAV